MDVHNAGGFNVHNPSQNGLNGLEQSGRGLAGGIEKADGVNPAEMIKLQHTLDMYAGNSAAYLSLSNIMADIEKNVLQNM